MKKMTCLFLSALLLLSVCACSNTEQKDNTTTTHPETISDQTTASSTPGQETQADSVRLPMLSISMPVTTESTAAEDGTIIFSNTYQDVSLIAPDTETADTIVLNLLTQIDNKQVSTEDMLAWAKSNYAEEESWYPYFYQVIYHPKRIDEKVLSLYGAEVSYSGGGHPNQVCVSATYDMATGKQLLLGDILTGSDAATALSQLIIEDLAVNKDTYQLYEGFAATANERYGGVSAVWSEQSAWFLSTDGLCVYFSPYDIAPYVVGEIVIEIPYEKLSGILLDDFIPAQLPDASGQVRTALAQDIDLEQYTQFAEAILDPNGERFIIYSDDLVTDILLEQGDLSADSGSFTVSSTVLAAHSLCDGDAIMVQSSFSADAPSLRLTYRSNDQIFRFLISQNQEDGSILMTELS